MEHDVTKPLRILQVERIEAHHKADHQLVVTTDRPATMPEIEQLAKLPPSFIVAADLRTMMERTMLMELALRVARLYVLSGVAMPEGPQAVNWLRDWMSGSNPPHGPLGGPMIWPDRILPLCALMRDWGYEPTPAEPGKPQFVTRRLHKPGTEPAPPPKSGLILNGARR